MFLALGWVEAMMLVWNAGSRAATAAGLLDPVGRLALSNYLL